MNYLWHILLGGCWALLSIGGAWPNEVYAQRPYRTTESFYLNEEAPRTFYDGYAATLFVSFQPMSVWTGETSTLSLSRAFAVGLRLEYAWSAALSGGMIVETNNEGNISDVSLNWLFLKYRYFKDGDDFALRLAVNPEGTGNIGFPQVDVAFLYSSSLTPLFTSDFAIGMRRVRMGFEEALPSKELVEDKVGGTFLAATPTDIQRVRILGQEIHLMMRYNVLFNPAGSRIFVSLYGESGEYERIAVSRRQQNSGEPVTEEENRFMGGTLWFNTGIEWNKPAYQVAPFLNLPLLRWEQGNGATEVGVRLTVR